MKNIKNYVWFIKESQSFMEGVHSKPRIFIESLFRGFKFCRLMNKAEYHGLNLKLKGLK